MPYNMKRIKEGRKEVWVLNECECRLCDGSR